MLKHSAWEDSAVMVGIDHLGGGIINVALLWLDVYSPPTIIFPGVGEVAIPLNAIRKPTTLIITNVELQVKQVEQQIPV